MLFTLLLTAEKYDQSHHLVILTGPDLVCSIARGKAMSLICNLLGVILFVL